MSKVKILMCSPMDLGGVGGIAKWTQYIMSYSQLNESNVVVEQYYVKTQAVSGGVFSLKRLFNGLRSYMPLVSGLKHKLKSKKYDIVHFSTSASISLLKDILTIKIAHKYGAKAVLHFHFGRIPQIFSNKGWEYYLLKKVINLSDVVVPMDYSSYNTLLTYGYRNVVLVPNPLSPGIDELIKNNLTVTRKDRLIVFAGHVIKTKGVVELIQACRDIPNINLHIYGSISQEMKDLLLKEAGDNNSSWLDIKGERDSESIIKAMLSANIFVLPTYTEGFPNVIIESMACACPIVTTPVGAIPEMLDINGNDKCGICVPAKDVAALKNAILTMLNNRGYAIKCGNNAKTRVYNLYSMQVVWSKLEQLWVSLVNSK